MPADLQSALTDGVVIIGASQAGARAAEALRNQGFAGPVTLLGDEVELPYERPSLSKEMLIDPGKETIAWVQKQEFYQAKDITLRTGVAAKAIDRAARQVALSDGSSLGYGALILATGARARHVNVPGATAETCHYVRTLEDSRRLRDKLIPGAHVVVIGAGFIGLEVAAAAIKRGCAATVVELATAPLGRVMPATIGSFYESYHTAQGVKFRFNTQLAAIESRNGGLVVATATGEEIPADVIVAGIGVIPNAELAADAGLAVDRGVVVDEYGATEDPLVFAVGDVSRHFNPRFNRHILLESWQNAQNQAIAVAKNLAHPEARAPYAEVPWFWSDQYDLNLQMYGLSEIDSVAVRRGSRMPRAGCCWS